MQPLSRIFFLILITVPYFLNLGLSALWDSNEALYGETAREMLERSDFIFPTFNYQPRTQKPPLTYWCIAASYHIFGVSEFSTRLPSAVGVCFLLLFLVWFLNNSPPWQDRPPSDGFARDMQQSGGMAALLAAAVLATTPRFFIVARRLPIDCLLTVFISVALLLLYRALHDGRTPAGTTAAAGRIPAPLGAGVRQWTWAASGVFTGLAFLTKGPVALLLVGITGAVASFVEKKRPEKRDALCYLGALLVTTVPYYWLLARRGGLARLYTFFVEDNLGRYTTLDFSPLRGVFYYFHVLPVDAFPWIWFLPMALVLWKTWGSANRPLLRFCWIWFLVVFVVFSLSRNKQEYYILPAYVPLAVLLGHFFCALRKSKGRELRWLRATAAALVLALAAVSTIIFWLAKFLPVSAAAGLIGMLLGGALLVAMFLWQGRPRRGAQTLALLMVAVLFSACLQVLPILETFRPTRKLARQIERLWRPGDRAGYFRFTSPS
ncbi:MAG: glycosyltransferase family 39 protein, partial [Acidobacteria bacterium]|nr:glycosyltransferase family 39 protein [Acidobacteriota bacterium]